MDHKLDNFCNTQGQFLLERYKKFRVVQRYTVKTKEYNFNVHYFKFLYTINWTQKIIFLKFFIKKWGLSERWYFHNNTMQVLIKTKNVTFWKSKIYSCVMICETLLIWASLITHDDVVKFINILAPFTTFIVSLAFKFFRFRFRLLLFIYLVCWMWRDSSSATTCDEQWSLQHLCYTGYNFRSFQYR